MITTTIHLGKADTYQTQKFEDDDPSLVFEQEGRFLFTIRVGDITGEGNKLPAPYISVDGPNGLEWEGYLSDFLKLFGGKDDGSK